MAPVERPENVVEVWAQDEHPRIPSGRRFYRLHRRGWKWVVLADLHDPDAHRIRLRRAVYNRMVLENEEVTP